MSAFASEVYRFRRATRPSHSTAIRSPVGPVIGLRIEGPSPFSLSCGSSCPYQRDERRLGRHLPALRRPPNSANPRHASRSLLLIVLSAHASRRRGLLRRIAPSHVPARLNSRCAVAEAAEPQSRWAADTMKTGFVCFVAVASLLALRCASSTVARPAAFVCPPSPELLGTWKSYRTSSLGPAWMSVTFHCDCTARVVSQLLFMRHTEVALYRVEEGTVVFTRERSETRWPFSLESDGAVVFSEAASEPHRYTRTDALQPCNGGSAAHAAQPSQRTSSATRLECLTPWT